MSPSGWSARRDSNPDLHGLGVPRLPIAPRADDVIGPSGWTRTTTSRVKSPVCCVHTTKGRWTYGANGGTRTRTSRLGRPAGNRYPTFALVRPTGIEPVPPRWQRGMHPPHSGRTWTGSVHRPIELCQLSKTPLVRAHPLVPPVGDSARIRTRTHEVWRLGCFRYTTLSLLLQISTVSETKPPHDLTPAFCCASGQNKKGLLGDRPRRPGSRRMQGL